MSIWARWSHKAFIGSTVRDGDILWPHLVKTPGLVGKSQLVAGVKTFFWVFQQLKLGTSEEIAKQEIGGFGGWFGLGGILKKNISLKKLLKKLGNNLA